MISQESPLEGSSLAREKASGARGWSEKLYGLDWNLAFPLSIASRDGKREIVRADFRSAVDFFAAHSNAIFRRDMRTHPFRTEPMSGAREHYYREAGDFFAFLHEGKVVGAFVGTASDWSTYYLRSCAVLPEHQGKGYFGTFLRHLMAMLQRAGVERVEGDVSPGNWVELHLFGRLGFRPTGTLLSERWGAVQRLTRYLSRACEEIFLQQFCDGPRLDLLRRS